MVRRLGPLSLRVARRRAFCVARAISRIACIVNGLSWRVYNDATRRIAQIVGAYPVTIQAADLPQALATGLINAFMTSSATGYDAKEISALLPPSRPAAH